MKKLLLIAILLTSCPSPKYIYKNQSGIQCFYQCQARANECAAYCPTAVCMAICGQSADSCKKACPGLIEIKK